MSRRSAAARASLTLSSLAVLSAVAPAQFAPQGQFWPPEPTPPLLRDRIVGEWLNLETELIEPILWIGPGAGVTEMVAVCNEPDDRVVFLNPVTLRVLDEVFVGQGPATLARRPGTNELWVSVRNQSCVVVIDLASRQVTHVLRRTIQPTDTGMGNATTPGGIAFSDGNAYVASSQTDELLVFDAATKQYTTAIPLKASHHGQDVALNDPFAVTAYGGKIWVASHLSGNQTTARIAGGVDLDDGVTSPTQNDFGPGHLGPKNVSIAKLGSAQFPGLALPDFDVAVVDPSGNSVQSMVRGLGTTLFDVEGHPTLSRLVVPNLEARNGDFIGESSFHDGKVVFNRLSWFDATTGALVGAPLVTEQPGLSATVVMPTDVELLPTGRMFVAGYCSSNVGCFAANGAFQGAIAASSGPRGLTTNQSQTRLWVHCRGANSVRAYDISNAAQLPAAMNPSEVALPDPTFDRVKAGRQQFLQPNSGADTTNCASCHVDGRMDGIAWNLSKSVQPASGPGQAPADLVDNKGVMVTQTLLGLLGAWPFHWRGEQEGVESFNDAFAGLLHGDKLLEPELALLTDYIESLEYPPNPRQSMNREHSHLSGGGFSNFSACIQCHFLPQGTSGDLPCAVFGDDVIVSSVETTHLRGLWLKASDEADIDPASGAATDVERVPVTGYGVLHEGVVDDLDQLLDEFFTQIGPQHPSLRGFLDQLDTGLAPATAFSELLDQGTANSTRADSIELFLIPQAEAGHCDLVARGLLDEGAGLVEAGLVWRRTTPTVAGHFESDDLNGSTPVSWTFAQLETKAASGAAALVFCGVPPGCGDRMGVDRDRDGMRDRDEVQATTAPADPDTDNDGWWDGYDSAPKTAGSGMPAAVPMVVPGSLRLVYATTNAIKLEYETDLPSPTIVTFDTSGTPPLTWTAGDGLQPTGSGTTNHWKRRHTAFLGPQPDATPPLPMLKPLQTYFIQIETQGQNGQTWSDAVRTTVDIPWEVALGTQLDDVQALFNNGFAFGQGSTFRASDIAFIQGSQSGANWTYDVKVWLEITHGTPNAAKLVGQKVAGRFTLHDSTGGYVTESQWGTIQHDSQNGTWWVDLSLTVAAPNHQTGDRVEFDLPMWIDVPLAGGGIKVGFPNVLDDMGTPGDTTDDVFHVGNWSDCVTHEEWIAP